MLQRQILPLQGYRSSLHKPYPIPIGLINHAFPNRTFPLGAVHEFIASETAHTAATCGFITGIISKLANNHGVTLWISRSRSLFPPALSLFGLNPGNIIFIDLQKELDCLWAAEEALKCKGLTAVVCETPNFSFTASRRFQLAVEASGVTGFILLQNPRSLTTTAAIARWRITPLNSQQATDLPGIGFPRWNVELLKVRNGKPGAWQIEFAANQFKPISNVPISATPVSITTERHKKAG